MEKTAFFKTLMDEVETIHITHIQAISINEHDILNVYKELDSLVDDLIESDKSYDDMPGNGTVATGNLLETKGIEFSNTYDSFNRMIAFRSFVIDGMRSVYGESIPSALNSVYDNIVTLINLTIYKLKMNINVSNDIILNGNTFNVLDFESFTKSLKGINVANPAETVPDQLDSDIPDQDL